jgi:arginine transport system substrate-binding protein
MPSFVKKYFIAIFFVAATLAFFVMKPFLSGDKTDQNTLIVGLQSGYPPFEFMDNKGNIIGFDVDIANLIAEKLEKKLIVKDMEFEGEILSLKQGKIDLILSGMNITSSRLKEISMVPYHGDDATSFSLIFWNEIPQGIHTLEDIAAFPNLIVSVQSGSVTEEFMNHYPQIQTKSFQGSLAPLMDVKYGKSAANLVEPD